MKPSLKALLPGVFVLLTLPAAADSVLIRDVQVVSPHAPPSGEAVNVLIDDGVIRVIGPEAPPAGAVIDGSGRYLVPGLIDTHVHLQGVPGESPEMPAAVRKQALEQIPRSYLYFGFTSVLDLFSADELVEQWNSQPLAPTAYHCAGVPIPGGYPLAALLPESGQLQGPAARFYQYDPRRQELMSATPGSERHKPAALVSRIAATGARCIKTFYETGYGRLKGLPVPTPEMTRELVAAAHAQGLPVFMHGNSLAAYRFALDTGVDMLVHGLWHGVEAADTATLARLADTLAERGLRVQPTIGVIHGERELFDPAFFSRPGVRDALPDTLIRWYGSPAGQWMARELAQGFGGVERIRAAIGAPLVTVQQFTRLLAERDAALVFGSDTPSGPIYTQFAGINGRWEIQRWAEQGVPPARLFRAVTLDNARLLGIEDLVGSVEVGKRADLLLLGENPLASTGAYDSIEWVILAGQPIERRALSARAPVTDELK